MVWCPVYPGCYRIIISCSAHLTISRPRSGLFSVSLIDWVVAGRSVLYSYTDPVPIISTTASLIHSTLNMPTMERRKIFTYSPALWRAEREQNREAEPHLNRNVIWETRWAEQRGRGGELGSSLIIFVFLIVITFPAINLGDILCWRIEWRRGNWNFYGQITPEIRTFVLLDHDRPATRTLETNWKKFLKSFISL